MTASKGLPHIASGRWLAQSKEVPRGMTGREVNAFRLKFKYAVS